jgi:hypothetical protein
MFGQQGPGSSELRRCGVAVKVSLYTVLSWGSNSGVDYISHRSWIAPYDAFAARRQGRPDAA